jgi:hypothetical protein
MDIKHRHHTGTWLHICMKQPLPSAVMITILLLATVENVTSVCSAMGRTKGLCDTANQQMIFAMDLDAYNHTGWEFLESMNLIQKK